MSNNTRANSTIFGYEFQINAAIVLMINYMKDLKTLKIEGNYEDIEIVLNDDKYILAQAKSVVKSSSDFTNVKRNLKKSLKTLSNGGYECSGNIKKYIYVTNSPNPFNDKHLNSIFYGPSYREYVGLPDTYKNIINNYLDEIDNPLDRNKFSIQIIPFETDDEKEKYKVVRQVVDSFAGKLELKEPGITDDILDKWQNQVLKNSTKEDADIVLEKKELIWPIIVLITKHSGPLRFCENDIDECLYEEIKYKYNDLINICFERFELYTKVIYDYTKFSMGKEKSIGRDIIDKFICEKWKDYIDEIKITDEDDTELQENIIKVILYNIVSRRRDIKRIKKGANL